jgi:hypothetical protein
MMEVLVGAILLVANTTPEVRTHGELRAVMHQRDFTAKVNLASILKQPHAYAVGALSGLRGEVTIIDGVAWLAFAEPGGKIRLEEVRRSQEEAALLVSARVPRWKRVKLTRAIPFADLDAAVESLARQNGIDPDQPFPFLVTGPVSDLAFHVIDGAKLPAAGGSHHDHASAGVTATRTRATGTLVGFFSKAHHGVFTHMGSNTHVHVVLPGEKMSGHTDKVTLDRGATLLLPR